MRVLALLTIGVLAAGQPPRGKRAPRPKATHLVVAAAQLEAGGVKVTLAPGVPVAASGAVPARGKVKVTVVGSVIVQGTIDAAALGKRVIVESELKSLDGKTTLGTARVGAALRVLAKKAPAGLVAVQSVGSVVVEGALPAAAVALEAREVVVKEDWGMKASKPAELFATPEVKGAPLARLEKDARLVLLEQRGEVAKVRTHGGFVVEGWTLNPNIESRGSLDAEKPEPRQKPTHEVFVDAPLHGGSDGKKTVGTVRGGTLVQADKRLAGDPAARIKVKTLGGVQLEGFMKLEDLRKLEDSVWSEEGK
jgi:hypothetical protein